MHVTAMLRTVLGAEATVVSSVTSSRTTSASVDTMAASVELKTGVQGTISVAYACSSFKYELEVVGTNGSVVLQRRGDDQGFDLVINENDAKEERKEEFQNFVFFGLDAEFLSFAKACKRRRSNQKLHRNTPEEAMMDLALVETLLGIEGNKE